MEPFAYDPVLQGIAQLPQPAVYKNSTPVVTVHGENLNVWEVLTAVVLKGLNALVVSERGEGKTQLQNDFKNTYFGGKATYIRMRDNLRVKEIYEVYNLKKLFRGEGTTLEAKNLTGAVRNPLTLIDEINRGHEKVQNQVFDIYDGYIIFDGPQGPEKINLGAVLADDSYYHTALASANIGASRYMGTNPIDPALLDRSHVILNLDNFAPTALDNALIIAKANTAKIIDTELQDHLENILEIHKGLAKVPMSLDALLVLLHLRKGLDYCKNPENATQSKLPVLQVLPSICQGCSELGNGCGNTYPISIRTEKAVALLAGGLKAVADAKRGEIKNKTVGYQEILSAFRIVAPYSGMLDKQWVRQEFMGNEQAAINKVAQQISKEITDLSDPINKSISEALLGNLSVRALDPFSGRWKWYKEVAGSFNDAAIKVGRLSDISAEEMRAAAQEHPILHWL